jgi:hypothetical protein
VAAFGRDSPIELAAPEPMAIAESLERLLDDPAERAQRSEEGMRLVAARTWDAAAVQLEAGLQAALDRARV